MLTDLQKLHEIKLMALQYEATNKVLKEITEKESGMYSPYSLPMNMNTSSQESNPETPQVPKMVTPPDLSITYGDLNDDDDEADHKYSAKSAHRASEDMDRVIDLGGKVAKDMIDKAHDYTGNGGSSFDDMTPEQHQDLSDHYSMVSRLAPQDSTEARVASVLSSIHSSACWGLKGCAEGRARDIDNDADDEKSEVGELGVESEKLDSALVILEGVSEEFLESTGQYRMFRAVRAYRAKKLAKETAALAAKASEEFETKTGLSVPELNAEGITTRVSLSILEGIGI